MFVEKRPEVVLIPFFVVVVLGLVYLVSLVFGRPTTQSSKPQEVLGGGQLKQIVQLSPIKQSQVINLENIAKTRTLYMADKQPEFEQLWVLAAEKAKLNGGYTFGAGCMNGQVELITCLINFLKS